ncbi:SIS domain-containing protein [Patescibacteria group bacterium]
MNLLDDINNLKKIDKSDALGSIEALPKQIRNVFNDFNKAAVLQRMTGFKKIALAGMGGSALAGRIVRFLYQDELKFPFQIITEYDLPNHIDHDTFLIISSYSGNTEETLSCLEQAKQKKAKSFAITTDGKIGQMIESHKQDGFIYHPRYNPLGYPKTAVGYSLGSLLAVFSHLNLINLSTDLLNKALAEFEAVQMKFFPQAPTVENPAKKLALEFKGLVPFLISSQHLNGATFTFRTQLNEIAHTNAHFYDLPEMNHHLVEAFGKPEMFIKHMVYLMIVSSDYHPRNQKRYQATQKVLNQFKIKNLAYEMRSESKLAQVLELVNLGGFTSAYLSIANHEDPGPEDWIIYLKKALKG